jgi:hypothetical protein
MDQAQTSEETQTETAAPKIKAMRRQPCPCGSGKVFKNCHEGDPGYEVATDPASAAAAPVAAAKAGPKGPAGKPFQGQAQKFSGGSASRNTGTMHRRKV